MSKKKLVLLALDRTKRRKLMSKKKQVLLALAREVIALYGGQSLPRAQSGVTPSSEVPQTEGQALQPGSGQVQTARALTTGKAFDGRRFVPSLRLQGQWLEQAGFPVGTRAIVQVQEGRIVLVQEER